MNVDILKNSELFKNMSNEEIKLCLKALNSNEKNYQRGELLLTSGNKTKRFGLVLDGSVTIENNDIWGNRTILSHVGQLQFFAETYALLEDEPLLVDVCANENCRILFFNIGSLKELKMTNEEWIGKFIFNMLMICANKNLALSGRSFHTSPKTIRERVLAYFNTVCLQKGSTEFDIPFDRQQLADYLNVDRSALSHELSKLQIDGIIEFRKNHFIIKSDIGVKFD